MQATGPVLTYQQIYDLHTTGPVPTFVTSAGRPAVFLDPAAFPPDPVNPTFLRIAYLDNACPAGAGFAAVGLVNPGDTATLSAFKLVPNV